MSERARVAASLPAAGLPHSEFLNYVIKFNATTWQEPNEVAFDRTKSFNNCKLLSQHFSTESLCPPAPSNFTCMPHATRLATSLSHLAFGISISLRRVTKYLRTLDVSSTLSSIPKPGILASHQPKPQPQSQPHPQPLHTPTHTHNIKGQQSAKGEGIRRQAVC